MSRSRSGRDSPKPKSRKQPHAQSAGVAGPAAAGRSEAVAAPYKMSPGSMTADDLLGWCAASPCCRNPATVPLWPSLDRARMAWRFSLAVFLRVFLISIACLFGADGAAGAEPKRVLLLHSFGPQF